MAEKLNNSLFARLAIVISIPKEVVCFFAALDLILLSVLGFLWTIILWSIVNTFFTTSIPSPCLPTVINTVISVSKVLREYLEVAQAFWNCCTINHCISNLSVPEVVPKFEKTYVSV